jgi:hypothetical protein
VALKSGSSTSPLTKYRQARPTAPPDVQGKRAGSWNEAYVAAALDYLGIPFIYQVDYFGGRSVRGGQVLDFLIYPGMGALTQGISVKGDYWHTGQLGMRDRLNELILEEFLGKPLIILWGDETDSFSDAVSALRRHL